MNKLITDFLKFAIFMAIFVWGFIGYVHVFGADETAAEFSNQLIDDSGADVEYIEFMIDELEYEVASDAEFWVVDGGTGITSPGLTWLPKEDITAHELALCMEIFLAAQCRNVFGCWHVIEPIYQRLPEKAKRHFEYTD